MQSPSGSGDICATRDCGGDVWFSGKDWPLAVALVSFLCRLSELTTDYEVSFQLLQQLTPRM